MTLAKYINSVSRLALAVMAAGLYLAVMPSARATITVDSSSSFTNITINPSSGTLYYLSAFSSSAYAQAGGNTQLSPVAANATDVPVPGGPATGSGTASYSLLTGSASATGFIPDGVAGFDTSAGRASLNTTFEITNTMSPVSVTFSATIMGNLSLMSDAYGVSGQGENVFTLSINGNPVLFNDQLLSIGPSQTMNGGYSTTLTDTITLTPDTTYSLWIEADSEANVVNGTTPAPEPSVSAMAGCGLLSLLAFYKLRWRNVLKPARVRRLLLLGGAGAVLALPILPAQAKYLGSDAPDVCKTCGVQPTRQQAGAISTSLSEGNIREDYPVVTVMSGYGPTLPFTLTYNSYNADGSKAQLDLGHGFGWTHTYDTLLFQQRGQMFRLGADGRVTQYYPSGNGTYTSDTGYFETLTEEPDGTFIVTNKYESWWHYGTVPNTPFVVEGPTYRLIEMGDRNGNTITMAYDAEGRLMTATDEFGRTLQFTYDSSNQLSTVEDPLGRITKFQYDTLEREPVEITDPAGNTLRYSYDAQYQMTEKIDKDGRTYFYMYKAELPFAVADSSGEPWFSMSNATDWAVNDTNLAYSLHRYYIPGTTENTDGNGRVWLYSYDTNGYITEIIAPEGSTTHYTYDPGSRMLGSTTDANGNTTTYQYDADGNRTNMTDALGEVTSYTYDLVFNQITSLTDPIGRTTTYQYDGDGNRIHEIDPLNETNSWTYDAHGNITSSTDKRGYTTTYAYDQYGERTNMTDPLGNRTSYAYDSIGNLITTTDPRGNTTQFQYDALDRVIGETNALGGVTTYTYDGVGRLLATTDPNTNTTSYEYDLRGRLIEVTDPLGGTIQYGYDLNNNRIETTNELGHVTTYAYDPLNRVVETIDPIGGITRYMYDPVGNVISSTDPNTNVTYSAYDALNRVVEVTNALDGVTTYDYSMPGGPPCCSPTPGTSLITRMQDPDGNITFYHYDDLNRRVQEVRKNSDTNDVINPGDAVTTTAYDAEGNVISVTDPNGNATTHSYDGDNRQISVVDAMGEATFTTYDGDGNVIQVVDPNLNATTNVYDALNREITVYDQVGQVRITTYDEDGNVLTKADGLGHTTTNTYDALDRQITVIDPLGKAIYTEYDADGNVTNVIDRNGHTTMHTYDAMDRQITTVDALSNATVTTYDLDGNVISRTDANDHTTIYTYDALNRMTEEEYPDSPPNTRTYSYDPAGNLISRTDQDGQVTTYTYNDLYYLTNRAYAPSGSYDQFTYDDGGRMLSGDRNGWVDTYIYDGANRLTNAVQDGRPLTYIYDVQERVETNTQPSGRTLVYTYDARDRLTTLGDETPNPPIVTYNYDDANRVVTRTYRNGTSATCEYDADDRMISLVHSNVTSLITGFDYAYDSEGNRVYEERLDQALDSRTYTYDALNRVTNFDVGTLSGPTIPSPTLARNWNLDPLGNWNTVTSNSVPEVRTHGPANELLTVNGSNYVYDANGNITRDNLYNYTYDEEDRLTQAQRRADSAIVGQYIYDATGRRVESITDPAGTITTNLYFYDGDRIIEEQNPAGSTLATYTYGNYVDEVLTMDRGGQTYYYHPDALWNVTALTDSSGNVAERYTYDAYGGVTVLDQNYNPLPLNPWGTPHSAVLNRFLFVGREFDEEFGIYYYRARFYDPIKGRFLQRDPLEYADDLNLYKYVDDRPQYATDPFGLLLLAIDGTGSEDWSKDDKFKTAGGFQQSHVKNFYDDYVGRKGYMHGPDSAVAEALGRGALAGRGGESGAIHEVAYNWLCGEWCKKQEPIDMVGHSRGGYIVLQIAVELKEKGCCCDGNTTKPVKVRFLGLYDAVKMSPGYGGNSEIPDNVQRATALWRDDEIGSRSSWGYGALSSKAGQTNWKKLYGTHAAIGGAPWSGDQPSGASERLDIMVAKQADTIMRRDARAAGVDIRMLQWKDYSYNKPND
jgi:RHS repeat-associated protein